MITTRIARAVVNILITIRTLPAAGALARICCNPIRTRSMITTRIARAVVNILITIRTKPAAVAGTRVTVSRHRTSAISTELIITCRTRSKVRRRRTPTCCKRPNNKNDTHSLHKNGHNGIVYGFTLAFKF